MKLDKISLNILGCCVLRDTFGMHVDDGGYIINRYVQIPNPISLVTKSPLRNKNIDITQNIFDGKSAFTTRCQILELKKQVFEYLNEKESEYLVIDCAEFRKDMLYFEETDGWFTESYHDLLEKYIEKGWLPSSYKIVNPLNEDRKDIYYYLKLFCDKLLAMYDKEHIILFEIKAVELHTDGKEVKAFIGKHQVAEKYNEKMKFCFDYVKSYLNGCYIVEFPEGVFGDTNHKWGRALLHYVPEYYDYTKKAVDIITGSLENRGGKEKALELLKYDTEKRLLKKYGDIVRKNLEELEKKNRDADKILKYEQYFKMLLMESGEERMFKFLKDNAIKSCAFYGRTQITYVLLALFTKWKINIEYVIENVSNATSWENIPLVKRDDIKSIKSKIIIVCDVNDSAIKNKLLNLKYEGRVYSYKELV